MSNIKGWQEREKELALKMLKEGADLAFVSKVTGLSENEIKKLQKNGC